MAGATANTRETYGAVGIREDLSNIIYNISPMDTPFMNGVGKGSCDNTYFEWQTDELAAAAANRQVEGDNPDPIAVAEPRRLGNYTQISYKTVMTSGTAEAVDFAGRKKLSETWKRCSLMTLFVLPVRRLVALPQPVQQVRLTLGLVRLPPVRLRFLMVALRLLSDLSTMVLVLLPPALTARLLPPPVRPQLWRLPST
jgi:hypothetical protein